MKQIVKSLILILLSISLASCGGGGKGPDGSNPGPFTIRNVHPRVFLTPERLAELKQNTSDPDFITIKNYVDYLIRDQKVLDDRISGFSWDTVMKVALTALVLNDPAYINTAKKCIDKVRQLDLNTDDYTFAGRLLALAIGYDWLHNQWTPDERKVLADKVVSYLNAYNATYSNFFINPSFVTNHSRYSNERIFAAALALYGEDNRINSFYDKTVANWRNGFKPVEDFVGREGGHYYSFGYGTGGEYGSADFNRMWQSATGELVASPYMDQVAYFYLYGTDPRPSATKDNPNGRPGSVLNFGDCATDIPGGYGLLCCAAYSYGNNLAQGYINSYFGNFSGYCNPTGWSSICLPRLLMKKGADFGATPLGLPQAREFRNSGFVMARDTWAGWPNGDPTILAFKSTPYYTGNHQHYDQNSLTVNYKGRLLIDSGVYDQYGSDHWKNYYRQSVAHNTLVVDNSGVQDQGQKVLESYQEPKTVNQLLLGGTYSLDGITKFAQTNLGCWMRGDASRAYNSSLVTTFVRDVLMVYTPAGFFHPVILVVDYIKLPTAQTPKILWHSSTDCKPVITGSSALVNNKNGGYARLDFLAPAGAGVATVGGSGYDAWVNGVNHSYSQALVDSHGYKVIEPGWGRIEVSSGKLVTDTTFVTLITVDGKTIGTGGKLISGPNWWGAKYGNSILIIGDSNNPPVEITINATDASGVTEAFVAGVDGASVRINGISPGMVKFF